MSSSLDSKYNQIQKICHEYDVDSNTPANGYRTFLTIVESFREQSSTGSLITAVEAPVYQSILEQTADLLLRIHQDSIKSTEDGVITDLDKDIYERIYDLADVKGKLGETFKPFWYSDKILRGFDLFAKMKDALTNEESLTTLSNESLKKAESTGLADIKLSPIPRINKWIIDVSSGVAELLQTEARTDDTVDCLIIRPKNMKHEDKILVYTHGGGFHAFNPSFYSLILTIWSNAIGVPIVAPFYRKSPTHKYPAGLQDCLDTYVFFTSEAPEVKELLGLSPRKSYLAGDSAGGNLAMGTTFALEMIRRSGGDVVLPSGINVHYPYPRPGPIVAPSNVFEAIDPIITCEGMAGAVSKYAKTIPLLEYDWYKQLDRKNCMELFQKFLKDPLFNNLSWSEWNSLANIPLIMLVCDFDPLMDSGLELAKKWKGKVRVTIAKGLPHGFALLASIMPEELNVMEADLKDMVNEAI